MKICIFGTVLKEKDVLFIADFLHLLHKKGIEVSINQPYLSQLKVAIDSPIIQALNAYDERLHLPDNTDYLFSIGGDGTLLKTAPLVKDSLVPIVGINVGRLGFLTTVNKDHVDEILHALFESNEFYLDKRSLIELNSDQIDFEVPPYGLNEFTIHKKDSSSMITIHVHVNDDYLTSYWADGLIIATPTGSTGYSLSCGGPIIVPNSNSFVITPIAPHNLNIRPLVISDASELSFEVEGRDEHFLCTLDARYWTIDETYELSIKKAKFPLNLVRLKDSTFYKKIRNKLNWGVDIRN